MTRPWSTPTRIVSVILALAAGGAAAYGGVRLWRVLLDPQMATVASAFGTVAGAFVGLLSAIAGAVAAYAAWRAARESSATALHATEALGLAMEPSLRAHFATTQHSIGLGPTTTAHEVVVVNTSRWAATDIDVDVRWWGGRTARDRIERIDPASQPNPTIAARPAEARIAVSPPERRAPTDDPGWTGSVELIDEIVVTYSDERGLLRWEKTCRSHQSYSREGRIEGSGYAYSESIRRLR